MTLTFLRHPAWPMDILVRCPLCDGLVRFLVDGACWECALTLEDQ